MYIHINTGMESLIKIYDWIECSPRFRSFWFGVFTTLVVEYLIKH
jgi:hypothetical protein